MSILSGALPYMGYVAADYFDDDKINASITKRPGFVRNLIVSLAGNKDLLNLISKSIVKDGDDEIMSKVISTIAIIISVTGIYLVMKEDEIKMDGLVSIFINILNIIRSA